MAEEPAPVYEPEYWTYTLRGGQFDGYTGRESRPRMVVHRPSRTDPALVLVYYHEASFVDDSGAFNHSVYRFHHEAFAVLVTEQDR
jgi:hypothetical protein